MSQLSQDLTGFSVDLESLTPGSERGEGDDPLVRLTEATIDAGLDRMYPHLAKIVLDRSEEAAGLSWCVPAPRKLARSVKSRSFRPPPPPARGRAGLDRTARRRSFPRDGHIL